MTPFYTWESEVQRVTHPRSQDRCKFFSRVGTPDLLEKQKRGGELRFQAWNRVWTPALKNAYTL